MSSFTGLSNLDVWHPSSFLHGHVTDNSSTAFTVSAQSGVFHFIGTGLTFNAKGFPTGGTITGFNASGGTLASPISVTGGNYSAVAFMQALQTGSAKSVNYFLYHGNDTFDVTATGTAAIHAGEGNDRINLGANFDASDKIDAGNGIDTVSLNGDYSAGVTLANDTLAYVNKIALANGHSYNLTLADGTIGAGKHIFVDGHALTASHHMTIDDTKETNGYAIVNGGAGSDTIRLGSGNDVIDAGSGNDLVQGGAGNDVFNSSLGRDNLQGQDGNDTFNLGLQLGVADKIDGGAGNDTVNLSGTYQGLEFGADLMRNVETLHVADGSSYNLTLNSATIASGKAMTVDASELSTGHTLFLDDSRETNGSITVLGGAGDDVVKTGSQNDTVSTGNGNDTINAGNGNDVVHAGAGNDAINSSLGTDHLFGEDGNDTFTLGSHLSGGDSIDGGIGNDTVNIDGDYANLVFGANTMKNVEKLSLGDGHSYALTLNDATIAAGKTLTVDAHTLGNGDSLTLDASSETNGALDITTGAASYDTVTGGAGNDTFHVAGGVDHIVGGDGNDQIFVSNDFTVGDTFDGGAGSDTLHLSETGPSVLTLDVGLIQNVETLAVDGSGANINLGANTSIAGPFTIDASGVTGGAVLDASNAISGALTLVGGDGDDTLTGGLGNDVLQGGLGADVLKGGGGADTFVLGAANDAVDTIVGFDAQTDTLDFANGVTSVSHNLTGGIASSLNDLTGLVTGSLGANEAMLVKPILGLLGGDTFMVVDQNGIAGFQSGQDLIVQLQNATHLNDFSLANILG